jgi:hypothetical protein
MPYKTQSPDTSPEMEKVMFDLLRHKTPAERFQMTSDLTESAFSLWSGGVKQRHPQWSEQEINIYWVEVHYGAEWADRIRGDLK